MTSQDILDRFFKVLHAEFGADADGHRRTKRQDRSLQVSFPEYDLYVDAVPARPYWDGQTWEIPQKGDQDEWVRTNPEGLTSLSSEMNAAHDGYYVPTVKLLRQTRRALLGTRRSPADSSSRSRPTRRSHPDLYRVTTRRSTTSPRSGRPARSSTTS